MKVSQVSFQGFFLLQNSSRKTMKWKGIFLKGVMLFVIKGHLPLRIIEPIWLQMLVYRFCSWTIFPSIKVFGGRCDSWVGTKNFFWVCLTYNNFMSIYNLDLWTLDVKRSTWHILLLLWFFSWLSESQNMSLIGLFEATNTIGATIAPKLWQLLNKF